MTDGGSPEGSFCVSTRESISQDGVGGKEVGLEAHCAKYFRMGKRQRDRFMGIDHRGVSPTYWCESGWYDGDNEALATAHEQMKDQR